MAFHKLLVTLASSLKIKESYALQNINKLEIYQRIFYAILNAKKFMKLFLYKKV
jgi:hypothetical protein